jgi:hypothetical protein
MRWFRLRRAARRAGERPSDIVAIATIANTMSAGGRLLASRWSSGEPFHVVEAVPGQLRPS